MIKENKQPLVAKEDLTVIKFLRKDSSGILQSSHCNYVLGEPAETVQSIKDCYHSFELPQKVTERTFSSIFDINKVYVLHYGKNSKTVVGRDCLSDKPYVCIIPKGTKYYKNGEHEIMSETIIVKEPYNRIKLFLNGIMKSISTFKKY